MFSKNNCNQKELIYLIALMKFDLLVGPRNINDYPFETNVTHLRTIGQELFHTEHS